MSKSSHRTLFVVVALVVLMTPVVASASHAWGSYHWARQSNPFTLKVHDNVTSEWDSYLATAASDWNASSVLNINLLNNSPLSTPRKCSSATGVIEVCNLKYGQNGWLGIAGISISGNHLTKGYTKLNDTYFNMATYNTPAYRAFVTCQEIGHDFGLGHVNETFTDPNTGSCMDYTNDPDGGAGGGSSNDPNNMHPNAHDYSMLESIYAHLDSTTTVAGIFDVITEAASRPQTIEEIMAEAGQWGTPIRFNNEGRPTVFLMPVGVDHAGENMFELTHVLWAPENPFKNERGGDIPELDPRD